MARKYTQEQRDETVKLYISGLSCQKISSKTGISVPYIKTILRKKMVNMRPSGFQIGNSSRKNKPHSEYSKNKISKKHIENVHHPSKEAVIKGQPKTLISRWKNHTRDPIKYFMTSYKTGAASRGLIFDLTRAEFELLILKSCFYCGQVPQSRMVSKDLTLTCNGIDRMDNSLGYLIDNCRAACKICNVMKLTHSMTFFIEHCISVARTWEGRERWTAVAS